MSQPNINCTVCGGKEFTLDSGFYFCLECNTQSQDVREVVFDEYFGNQKATTRALKKKASKIPSSGPNERLTSWEVLNYIMKGITDELLDLGAKKELKLVTLQLWASYLHILDVAFTSLEIERKPKLGFAFKRSDAEIVYGVTEKHLKGKIWRSRSRLSRSRSLSGSSVRSSDTLLTSDTTNTGETSASGESRRSILRKLSLSKKALASAEYSQMSQSKSVYQGQTLEDLELSSDGDNTPQSHRIKITRHAKKLLSSCYATCTEDEVNAQRKLARKENHSIRNLTIEKIAALSNVALALTNQDIQVSDYIRWVEEGHISLLNPQKFLPEGKKAEPEIQRLLEHGHLSYTPVKDLMIRFSSELGIDVLPPPDLTRLAERYCLELQLPDDLVIIIKEILLLVSYKHDRNTLSETCYEAQAMAAIIVSLKLLFSLDDCTEYHLSHTATELNRVTGNQLFVFTDWMKFIECRKAVISAYHLPTRTAVYGDTVGRDPQLFLQHYAQIMEQQQMISRDVNKRYALNKTWVEAMVRCLHKLTDRQPQCEVVKPIHFPASLTPLHTYCQVLLSDHADKVSAASPILSQHFNSHSLEFILSPDRMMALGLADDVHIFQRPEGAAAIFMTENNFATDKFEFVIPKFQINQFKVSVRIVKNVSTNQKNCEGINNVEEENNFEKSNGNINSLYTQSKDIIAEDSDDEEINKEDFNKFMNSEIPTCHTLLQLFNTGSQYWCTHIYLSKNKMNNDEFDFFAMKHFSSSFWWLLKECSRTIKVSNKDLYTNVVAIEKKISSILIKINKLTKRRR